MDVISVVSAKGGVGKSTLTANLAVALQRQGQSVLVIDTDPQNSLHYHFSFKVGSGDGLVHAATQQRAWSSLIATTPSGVDILPYGQCSEPEREHFEALLHRTPRWLFNALQVLDRPYDAIVIDTPPGASGYLSQVLTASSVVVGVARADAGSYVTLPQLQSLVETYCGSSPHFKRFGVVVNQVDHNKPLNRDVVSMIKAAFPDHVIGLVHEDESVCEALAYGQDIFTYAPHSEAGRDISMCAKWLLNMMRNHETRP